jgi:prophage antirepressor-like protein
MASILDTLDENYLKFENKLINVIIDNDNNAWFNANQIASALGYDAPKKAISYNIDEDEKKQLEDINTDIKTDKHPHSIYLSESGLYSLMLSSRLPKAQKFKKWITKDVIPSIRKYGYYKQQKNYENELSELMEKINYLIKENENMKNELKHDLFPNGGVVYVIDYSDNGKTIYRIGKTGDMKARKSIYDTHTLYKKKVVDMFESDCPIQLETCIRSMLYKFRIKNKKDFYECDQQDIKRAFKNCVESFECMKKKKDLTFDNTIKSLQERTKPLKKKIIEVKKKIK